MRYRVAVVGAGLMGRVHAQSYSKTDLGADVCYIVDNDINRALQLAAELPGEIHVTTDYLDVLSDPQVHFVDICAPTRFHCHLVVQAAAAGKHVLCEKPIALDLQEAEEMIGACRHAGIQFMVAHILRFWPEYVKLVDLVRAGRIGTIRQIACWRLSTPPGWSRDNWLIDVTQSGFAIYDLAIHDYDVVRWLAGTPEAIHAGGDAGHFTALFHLPNGVAAQVEASFTMPVGFPFRMGVRVTGDAGMIEFDGAAGTLTLVAAGEQQIVTVEGTRAFKQDNSTEELDGYAYEIAYFIECLRTGQPLTRITPEDARDALAIATQVERSLKEGVASHS